MSEFEPNDVQELMLKFFRDKQDDDPVRPEQMATRTGLTLAQVDNCIRVFAEQGGDEGFVYFDGGYWYLTEEGKSFASGLK